MCENSSRLPDLVLDTVTPEARRTAPHPLRRVHCQLLSGVLDDRALIMADNNGLFGGEGVFQRRGDVNHSLLIIGLVWIAVHFPGPAHASRHPSYSLSTDAFMIDDTYRNEFGGSVVP